MQQVFCHYSSSTFLKELMAGWDGCWLARLVPLAYISKYYFNRKVSASSLEQPLKEVLALYAVFLPPAFSLSMPPTRVDSI
jgi:hypothetical protein